MSEPVDRLVAASREIPDFLAVVPELKAKALLASKTVWGMAIATIVSGLVAHYHLAWDEPTSQAVAGLIEMGAAIALRRITTGPVSGWLPKGPTP